MKYATHCTYSPYCAIVLRHRVSARKSRNSLIFCLPRVRVSASKIPRILNILAVTYARLFNHSAIYWSNRPFSKLRIYSVSFAICLNNYHLKTLSIGNNYLINVRKFWAYLFGLNQTDICSDMAAMYKKYWFRIGTGSSPTHNILTKANP
jgi:hypothetical protein